MRMEWEGDKRERDDGGGGEVKRRDRGCSYSLNRHKMNPDRVVP